MTDPLDAAWRAAHPLPGVDPETDKNSRGTVLAVGGSRIVPGALALTAEAALRAGAGKVRLGLPEEAALGMGLLHPEFAVTGLPTGPSGELSVDGAETIIGSLERVDTLVLGPGMGKPEAVRPLVRRLLASARDGMSIVLDAAAISCSARLGRAIAAHHGRVVLTPHHGEMAALMACNETDVSEDDERLAMDAARRFDAVIVLKSARTVVAGPDGTLLRYAGGGPGLATAGSGDVLAGIIGGLLARGADPLRAAAWGVWLHGEAGRLLARRIGKVGFLARELSGAIPSLMGHPAED